jgi:site-specific recombinase XerD
VQKAIRRAVQAAEISKPATSHTLRHSFGTHLLERGHDITTIQELLGHLDVNNKIICTHVLNRGLYGIASPPTLCSMANTMFEGSKDEWALSIAIIEL